MNAVLLFIFSFVMLFMALFLVDKSQLGVPRTLLQIAFFGLFFLGSWQAALMAFSKREILSDSDDDDEKDPVRIQIISKTVKPVIRRIVADARDRN